ncbi:MAG: isoleucine--tRNA ligase [Parachlamydiales bacterium]
MLEPAPKKTLPELEEETLAFWEEAGIFQKSLERRRGAPPFVQYDGPPFATGLPHYGHHLTGTIKDVVMRYKTMEGFYAMRRFGWDCHGLPIENEIEKAFELEGAHAIEEFGVARFNRECEKIVQRYVEEWRTRVGRMGRWVDWDKTYKTMDLPYMESVWWVFKQLFDKELVYEGLRVMPYSAKLGTPLSNFEANENYKEVDDPSLIVTLPLVDEADLSLLIWTTTPWTLPMNLAVMVGPEVEYVKVAHEGHHYLVAASRKEANLPEGKVVGKVMGRELEGRQYVPPFAYFQDHPKAFRVLLEEGVSTEEGTGIVHCAPAFGEVDFFAAQRYGIEPVCPVDQNGQFTAEVAEYVGHFVKRADKDIAKRLKGAGRLFHQGTIRHRYPFCWRSDTPLIYKAVSTWFVKVEPFREGLLRSNDQIHWMPAHLKEGRFGKWLAQARDWNIARSRYWGTPIPIWRSDEGDLICIGSIGELEKRCGKKIDNLHRHHIDELTFEEGGKTYRRIPQVFDCWFESGSMPYAQNHYPFSTKELEFPADFIAEGLDQTRGWFYTLTVLSTLLFEGPAFKNVIVNGILLAEDGNKMSKRLKNYPEPEEVIRESGADAVRLYLLGSPAVRADDLRFSKQGVALTLRQVLLPLWNSYSFLTTYARIYNWEPKEDRTSSFPLDRWILSRLHKLVGEVRSAMTHYDLSKAVEPIATFVEELTNWYIRLSRRRFWEDEDGQAFQTLYTVLLEVSKVCAPFIPFLSETLYRALRTPEMAESVHLCDFPQPGTRDMALEEEMGAASRVVTMGHALRKGHKIKVRQPLRTLHIVSSNRELQEGLRRQQSLIASELNVKEVRLSESEEEFVTLQVKPNFPVLGKKVGPKMRAVQAEIAKLGRDALNRLQSGSSVTLEVEGEKISLTPEDVAIQRSVKGDLEALNEGELTVLFDTKLDEELLLEGLARELVNRVSQMRKEAGLEYTDRITLTIETTPRVQEAFGKHADYVQHELLATEVTFAATDGEAGELNGESCKVKLQRGV